MDSHSHDHPADHPNREIEEDVVASQFLAWLGVVGVILIVASVFALTGLYYQTERALEVERYAEAAARPATANAKKLAADKEVLHGYHRGIPSPEGVVEEGPDAKTFVSIPVEEGKRKVLDQYKK